MLLESSDSKDGNDSKTKAKRILEASDGKSFDLIRQVKDFLGV